LPESGDIRHGDFTPNRLKIGFLFSGFQAEIARISQQIFMLP